MKGSKFHHGGTNNLSTESLIVDFFGMSTINNLRVHYS